MHKDPSKTMSPEMKTVYDDFYANAERLRSEWNLCNQQYQATIGFTQGKEQDWEAHMAIRRISDYWIRRRTALERAIPKDLLESFQSES
jgi:hypothetical protein